MLELHCLTDDAIRILKNNIDSNYKKYVSGNASDILKDLEGSQIKELGVEYNAIDFQKSRNSNPDVSDALNIYDSLGHFAPSKIADKGIWVYLTHYYGEYTYTRWLSSMKDIKPSLIESRFFRTREKYRQSILGLWLLSTKVNESVKIAKSSYTLESALELLFEKAGVAHRLFEFTNFYGNSKIMLSILNALENRGDKFRSSFNVTVNGSKGRVDVYRELFRSLDRINPVRFLPTLEQDVLNDFVLDEVEKIHTKYERMAANQN